MSPQSSHPGSGVWWSDEPYYQFQRPWQSWTNYAPAPADPNIAPGEKTPHDSPHGGVVYHAIPFSPDRFITVEWQ